MKVAHLTTVDLSLRFLVFAQLRSIVQRGGEALGISAPGPWVADLEEAGVRHLVLASSTRGIAPLDDLRAAWQLWRHLRREKPAVLHTHNPKPGLYGRIVGRLAGVPVVVNTVHGLYAAPDDPLVKRALVYSLEAVAARCSDVELIQSREDLDLIRRLHIAPRTRARYLGNGVDLHRFDPDNPARRPREAMRAELGLRDDEVAVGVVGRLVAEKGFPELFEAMRELEETFRLVVVGPVDPDKPDALPPEVIDRARSDGVTFLGMRADVDDLYQAMDLFVLPSHREGFPRSAMEAAAMGLPVVATDIRGCREVVEDGVNGLLVPVRDPGSLRAAITRLGNDRSLRATMGAASRAKARVGFDEQKVVERVLDAYGDVARRKGLTALAEMVSSPQDARVREAVPADAPALARLHLDGITSGFLPRLGERFLRQLYRALIDWSEAVIVVADRGSGPIGYVAGVSDTGRFFSHFYRRHAGRAVLAAFPALLRPSTIARAWETARYSEEGGEDWPAAELLSMAVDPSARRQGIGRRLGEAFLDAMQQRGVAEVKVVVGAANRGAVRTYESMGFFVAGRTEVHPGQPSVVMQWSA